MHDNYDKLSQREHGGQRRTVYGRYHEERNGKLNEKVRKENKETQAKK